MTDAALNEALAKWDRWTRCACGDEHCGAWFAPGAAEDQPSLGVPNYTGSLDAVATLEAKAPDEYWSRLWTDTGAEIMSSMVDQSKALAGASPRLRSETLAKTAGVWREGE